MFDILFFITAFTSIRIDIDKKNLNKSRAYLAIPILIYNLYNFCNSKKNLIEPDANQSSSTDLMLAMFISDLILFLKNKTNNYSVYFHHIFCSLCYLISKYNGTPKIYTLMSLPELMIFGSIIKRNYRTIFYILIIFFRYPFWYILFKNYKKISNNIVSKNALVGSITMFSLDTYWLLELTKKILDKYSKY